MTIPRCNLFCVVEEPCAVWTGREPEEGDGGRDDRHGSLDDKKPHPTLDRDMADLEDTIRDQAAKRRRKQGTTKEDGDSKPKFTSGVKEGHVEDHTGEEPCLEYAVARRHTNQYDHETSV